MRGSLSSPRVSSSPTAAWISAPTRSGRPGTLMAETLPVRRRFASQRWQRSRSAGGRLVRAKQPEARRGDRPPGQVRNDEPGGFLPSGLLPVALVAQLPGAGTGLGEGEVSPTPRPGPPLDQRSRPPVPVGHPLGLGQTAVLASEGQLEGAPVVRWVAAGWPEELVAEGQDLQLSADQWSDVHLLHEVDHLLDLLVHVTAIRAHHRQRDGGPLPEVLVFHLGYGDVEPRLEPVGDSPKHL